MNVFSGSTAQSVLCQPIIQSNGELIGEFKLCMDKLLLTILIKLGSCRCLSFVSCYQENKFIKRQKTQVDGPIMHAYTFGPNVF